MNKLNYFIIGTISVLSASAYAIDMSTWLGGSKKENAPSQSTSSNPKQSNQQTGNPKPVQSNQQTGNPKPVQSNQTIAQAPNINNSKLGNQSTEEPRAYLNTPINEAQPNTMNNVRSAINSDDSLYEAATRSTGTIMPRIQQMVQGLGPKQQSVVMTYSGLLLGMSLGSSNMSAGELSQMVDAYNRNVSCGTAMGLAPTMNQARSLILGNQGTGTLYSRNSRKFGNLTNLGTNGDMSKCI